MKIEISLFYHVVKLHLTITTAFRTGLQLSPIANGASSQEALKVRVLPVNWQNWDLKQLVAFRQELPRMLSRAEQSETI
jgi:hypothetical protein